MFDWGGEQMALYLGKELGDLLIVTLNKSVRVGIAKCAGANARPSAVEAVLAIVLLKKCE